MNTWLEANGVRYGAQPDARGPLGGGDGYTALVTGGDVTVADLPALIEALQNARAGQTVFLNPRAEIELTERVRAFKLVLEIPGGVTLASNRGQDGAPGALLFSEEFDTFPLLRVTGPGARVTGLRLRGPDPKRRLEYHRHVFYRGGGGNPAFYYFPVSTAIATQHARLEVDNCELSGWSQAAVYLDGGHAHRVHHNHIHHNQRQGLGYGVALNRSDALIEHNVFDHNKHSIAGTGRSGCGYEARHNLVLAGTDCFRAFGDQSHLFDMHGGRDRVDGTSIAGTRLDIHHNTFVSAPDLEMIVHIRGVPEEQARVHHNWFRGSVPGPRVIVADGHLEARDNAYGESGVMA